MKTAGCVKFVHFLIAFALDSIVATALPAREYVW